MLPPEPEERLPADLARALGAIRRTQSLWLVEVDQACHGEPAFVAAFRRWEELLTALKLHVHRAENRLLHYALDEPDRPRREYGGRPVDREQIARRWVDRLTAWFAGLRLDPTYLRLPTVIAGDDDEPVTADIITDLATLAEVAESTMPALAAAAETAPDQLEDLAFYHIVAPWRSRGLPPLLDVLRWLAEMVREHDTV